MPVIHNGPDYKSCATDDSRAELLLIIEEFMKKNGYSPSYREIAFRMKFHKSTSSIKQIMHDCKKKGLLAFVPGIARTCTVTTEGKKFLNKFYKRK